MGDICLGYKICKCLKSLNQKQWWTKQQISADQSEKLQIMIEHIYNNVPFWRKIFEERGLNPSDIKSREDLHKLPVINKDLIRSELERLKAANLPQKAFRLQHSSGSTGEPVKYYSDKNHYSWNIASMFRNWEWAGYEPGIKWVRLSLWPHNKITEKFYDKLARCLYIRVYSMDNDALERDVKKIKNYNPEIIRGYASAAYVITKYAADNGITGIKPKAVITTGDMLYPHYRKLMEDFYQCKVYDTYGGEGTMVYGQCEKGGLHIDDNNVIVEFLKSDGTPAEPGQQGNITLTCLNNFVMPFIRYNIQDVGIKIAEDCPCGRKLSLMYPVQGRNSDIITTPNGSQLIVHFFTGLFEFIEGVDQFQVTQAQPDEIEVKIVKNEKFTDADRQKIADEIKTGGGDELKIKFNFVEQIPLASSGKRRFVISKIKPII